MNILYCVLESQIAPCRLVGGYHCCLSVYRRHTLQMVAVRTSEKFLITYPAARCYNRKIMSDFIFLNRIKNNV